MKKQLFTFLLFSNLVYAQTAKLDTNAILIGQQIDLTISNSLESTTVWPNYVDTVISGIEIIKTN